MHDLNQHPANVDTVGAANGMGLAKRDVSENLLDGDIQVVRRPLDANHVNAGLHLTHGRHLQLLQEADATTFRVQHRDAHIRQRAYSLDGRAASVPACAHQQVEDLARPREEMLQEAGKNLHAKILEGQGRPMPKLTHVNAIAGRIITHADHRVITKRTERVPHNQGAQVVIGDLDLGNEQAHDLIAQLWVRQRLPRHKCCGVDLRQRLRHDHATVFRPPTEDGLFEGVKPPRVRVRRRVAATDVSHAPRKYTQKLPQALARNGRSLRLRGSQLRGFVAPDTRTERVKDPVAVQALHTHHKGKPIMRFVGDA